MSLPQAQKNFLNGFKTYIASVIAATATAATYVTGHIDVIQLVAGLALSGAPAALRASIGGVLKVVLTVAQDVQALKAAQQPVSANVITIPVDHVAVSNAVAGIVTNAIANKPVAQ